MQLWREMSAVARLVLIGVLFALGAGGPASAEPASGLDQGQEIAVFRREIVGPSAAFSPEARAEAERRLAKLELEAGKISEAALTVEICRIAALADNLHSSCIFHPKAGAPLGSPICPGASS